MRKIKFRRKNLRGEWIYTELFGEDFTNEKLAAFAIDLCGTNDYSTISQLVGVDKNGREVYEGDSVVDEWGNEFRVVYEPEFLKTIALKETDHEED